MRSITVTRVVVAQRPRELAAADVDRDHVRRAAPQQAVGEAAGRRADVDRAPARDVDAERVERARELRAAARHELLARRLGGDDDRLGRVDLARRGGRRARRSPRPGRRRSRRPPASGSARARAARARRRGVGARSAGSLDGRLVTARLRRGASWRRLLRGALLAAFFAGARLRRGLLGGRLRRRGFLPAPSRRLRAGFGVPRSRRSSAARSLLVARPSTPSWRCTSVRTIVRSSSLRRRLISTSSSTAAPTWSRASWPWRDEIGGELARLRAAQLGELHAGLEHALPVRRLGHRVPLSIAARRAAAVGERATWRASLGPPDASRIAPAPRRAAAARGAARSAATNGGGGSGTGSSPRAAGDAREHERERPAERGRERAVGRRPVADHHAAVAEPRPHEVGHRRARACPRPRARARPRSRPRRRARRRPGRRRRAIGIGRIEVGRDEARAGRAPRRRRAVRPSKSKSRWKPTTTASAGGRRRRPASPRCLERLDHARARAREHRAPGGDASRDEHGRGLRARAHVVGRGRDAERARAARRSRRRAGSSCS